MAYNVAEANMQPPVVNPKFHGRSQLETRPEMTPDELRKQLLQMSDELQNSIANIQDASGGILDGVMLSAVLGVRYVDETCLWLAKRV